jgi:ligand-binding sensor domain-containing protein/serine phosphatase RsbU (regulator of sigma subunit)
MKLLYTFFFLALSFLSFSQELSFSTFNEKQGITQPYVYNIGQNSDGFLCFTTSEGAYQFDGLKFLRLDRNGLLKESFFKSMLLMKDKSSYLGSNTGGVFRLKNGKVIWKFVSSEYTAPVNYIQEFKNKVYAFYQDGNILEIDENGNRKFYKLEPGYLYSTFSMFGDKFIAGKDNGFSFFSINNGRLIEEPTIIVNDDAVESFCVHKTTIFIGTAESGLYRYKNRELTKIVLEKESLNTANIKAIHNDDLTSIWISAYGDGVYEIKQNSSNKAYYVRSSITKERGIPSQYVTSIFLDRESNLWLGTLGKGLSKLNSNSLIQYDLTQYGHGNQVHSVYSGAKQMCGMKGGILEIDLESDEVTQWYLNSQLPKDNLTAINYHYPSKTFFIGTSKSGLYMVSGGANKLTKIELSVDFLSMTINHININGNMAYISTMNGLYRYNIANGKIEQFSSKDGLPNNVVYSTFNKGDGKILLGTMSNGIYYLQNNKIQELKIENPYGLLDIYGFCENRRGQLWFGTNGQGVFHLSDKIFSRVSSSKGLYSDFIYQLVMDKKFTIWCGHRGGLSRVTDQDKVLDKFDYSDNIAMDFYLNASSSDQLNNLWFGTSEGVMKFSIAQDKFNIYNAKPVLIEAMVNDIALDNPSRLKLEYRNNKLKFTFQTVSLTFPDDIFYQYRLKGQDNKWSIPSKENTAILGQILNGEYKLEVRSKVGNGEWSSPYVLSEVSVSPPWWLQWYSILIAIGSVIGFIFLISSYRTRALKRQTAILEEKLAIRTKEIENKNAKITQQFDEMQESIDYGVRIQNSLLPSPRTLKSILPDSFLFFQPKDKVSGDFYYFEKFENRLIVSVADATGHGVPGAFISLIGFVKLKEIVHRSSVRNPARALSELDFEINTTLGQFNRENDGKDGMDMAICEINTETGLVTMASALRPIWIFSDGIFEKIRSSKFSVGSGMEGEGAPRKEFDIEQRQLKKGDTIYMLTDGYVDQFGSDRDKKLMSKRFFNLIKLNAHLPMDEQGRIISKFLNDWKGPRDQTDDILVIGLRI